MKRNFLRIMIRKLFSSSLMVNIMKRKYGNIITVMYSLNLHMNSGFCQNKTNLINLSFMSIPFIYLHERGAWCGGKRRRTTLISYGMPSFYISYILMKCLCSRNLYQLLFSSDSFIYLIFLIKYNFSFFLSIIIIIFYYFSFTYHVYTPHMITEDFHCL